MLLQSSSSYKGRGPSPYDDLLLVDPKHTLIDGIDGLSEWTNAARWFIRYRGSIGAGFPLMKQHSWEQRFIHLERIRILQDEDPGIHCLVMRPFESYCDPHRSEEVLRAILLSSLFVGNVRIAQEVDLDSDWSLSRVTGLSICPTDVILNVPLSALDLLKEKMPVVEELRDYGIEVESLAGAGTGRPLH